MKKTAITIGSIASIAIPLASVVACGEQTFDSKDYDFGIAIAPINTLNYIKSKSLYKILPTLVQGLIMDGPSTQLKNQLQIPKFDMELSKFDPATHKYTKEYRYWRVSEINDYPGNLAESNSLLAEGHNPFKSIGLTLNGEQKWKGASNDKYNRVITAQDYIDYITYVMDLNVGSEQITAIREIDIKGLEDIYQAQLAYSYKTGKTYANPFGKNVVIKDGVMISGVWDSQTPGDKALVDNIKAAATKFFTEGMYTYSKPILNGRQQSPNLDKTQFIINFNLPSAAGKILGMLKKILLPANKEFIESVGGISKFGSSPSKFIYSSPFNIDDIRLGQGGYIILEKDKQWPTASRTVSNKIKVFFQSNPNVASAMFNDKYISSTDIPSVYQKFLWSSAEDRQFMKKREGVGTMALQFNLDKSSNSPLLNENLRNAIAYSVNRAELLKLLNWDASFPVTTWTPQNSVYSADGRPTDTFLQNVEYATPYQTYASNPNHRTSIAVSSFDLPTNTAKRYKFEHANRVDNRFDLNIARKYFEAYKKETGNSTVSLKFLAADKVSVDTALGLKTMFARAFGSAINLEIKQVPQNSYVLMRKTAQFDLTTYNFDSYGESINSYMKHLFFTDDIDKNLHKTTAFEDNPTGSWNFNVWYKKHIMDLNNIKTNQLLIATQEEEDVWAKVLEAIKIEPFKVDPNTNVSSKNKQLTDLLDSFWGKTDPVIDSDDKLFILVSIFERIVALSSPIVPILEVDNAWVISRLGGISQTYSYSLQFAYDVLNKPSPILPGKDSLNG